MDGLDKISNLIRLSEPICLFTPRCTEQGYIGILPVLPPSFHPPHLHLGRNPSKRLSPAAELRKQVDLFPHLLLPFQPFSFARLPATPSTSWHQADHDPWRTCLWPPCLQPIPMPSACCSGIAGSKFPRNSFVIAC